MKKLIHITSVTAILTFVFLQAVSCGKAPVSVEPDDTPSGQKEEEVSPSSDEYAGGEVTVKARIQDSMQSKVSYPSTGGSVWNGGDQLAVWAIDSTGTVYRKVQFGSIQDGSEISFRGIVPAGYKLSDYAVYPYSSKHFAGTVDGVFTMSVYTGGISSKDVGDGPVQMIGVRGQDGVFVFRHCAGALRLSLTNMPAGTLTVTLTADTATQGRYGVDMSTLLLRHDVCDLDDHSFSVKTHADDLGNAQVVFPLPEGRYSDISFSVADSMGDEVMVQSFPDPVDIQVGQFCEKSMELVIDTTADFSRWMRNDTTFVNHIETEDLAQHGQLLNGCDTLFYMHDSHTLYGYISVPISTATLQAQLRELHVYIDHCDDQTTQFNPTYDLGWLDQHAHYDLMFQGSIYQSGRIRKIEDGTVVLYKICPTQQPEESFGWMGGVTRGNSTQENLDHGYRGSGVFQEDGRFRYQFELDRDVALITPADLLGYSWQGETTGIVNVMVVVSDHSYSHSSICPDREGTDIYMLPNQ